MNILQIISYLYPAVSYGGPGKLVFDISLALAKRGHHVTVYTTDAYDDLKRRDRNSSPFPAESNIKVNFFRNISNSLAFRQKLFLPLAGYGKIQEEMKTFDVVHSHEFFTPLHVASTFFARKSKVPFVLSAHGTLDSFHLNHKAFMKRIFMKTIGDRSLKQISSCIAATDEEVGEYALLGIGKEKIYRVANGVNIRDFSSLPPKGRFRKKFDISSKALVVLYVGRIHKLKGLESLIEGFTKLNQDKPSILVIAGSDDGYLEALQKQVMERNISKQILFPGKLFGKEKLEAFADSDIFVYPSPSEGFSIAILEAAAAGLPLVITRGCKFPEVELNNAGVITDADSNGLYHGLNTLLRDGDKMSKMGRNAKRLISVNYSIDTMVKKLEKVYSNTMNAGQPTYENSTFD